MLEKIQQDFSYYSHEFKDNYRKGVHRLRTILASKAQAQAFAGNAGGTAVVLGYDADKPDKNAEELYALLADSPYIDDAVQTFLGSIYEDGAESQDAMYADNARCLEILHDPVMARAAGAGAVSAGKWVATLAGQSCDSYKDITAVLASETAMTAVLASETAMTAVAASETAMTAVAASETAMTAVLASETAMTAVLASETAMAAVAASETAMTAVLASETAMTAVLASETAMAAVAASETAMTAVLASKTAIQAIAASYIGIAAIYSNATALAKWNATPSAVSAIAGTSSVAIGKAAVKLAGLQPDNFTDMTAVAASSTAMTAVAASSTAMTAVAASSTAMTAVAASSTAMTAVAASSTAMTAVAAATTARQAIEASTTAKTALYNSPLKQSAAYINATSWSTRRSGKVWLISFTQSSYSRTNAVDHRYTLEGNGTIECTLANCCNTEYRADRFMDSITNYNAYTSISFTYSFIPC